MKQTFAEALSQFMDTHKITAAYLSKASGISAPVISRLKSGKREFTGNSTSYKNLVEGLSYLSGQSIKEVKEVLSPALQDQGLNEKLAISNLTYLISYLDLNVNDLSRFLNFDSSYLSRIRHKKRRPADLAKLLQGTSRYLYQNSSVTDLRKLEGLLQMDLQDLSEKEFIQRMFNWLTENEELRQEDYCALSFLEKLDRFDLNEYLKSFSFPNTAQTLSALPADQMYRDAEGFRQAEQAWLQAVVQNPQADDVYIYSDLPMAHISQDPVLAKEWIMDMMAMTKKGCHIHMIHTANRSFYEMMLGLESFIPLYMTGQLSPYYLKDMKDPVFHHSIRSASNASVAGEAIVGFHDHGRYYFSTQTEEVAYQRLRAQDLLCRATPLMEIYSAKQAELFKPVLSDFLQLQKEGFHHILSMPMLYTMPEELLDEILASSNLCDQDVSDIRTYYKQQRTFFLQQIVQGTLYDEVRVLDESEFEKHPVLVSLPDLFGDYDLHYTYPQYKRHIESSQKMAQENENYYFRQVDHSPFGNLQIRIILGQAALISKNKAPAIHFLIRHPKLRKAIETMSIKPGQESAQ